MESTQFRCVRNGGLPLRRTMESKSTRNMSCSNCSQIFSVRDPLHPRGLRCPLILHCGHSACENCIRISLHNSDRVVCGICKCTSTAAHQNTDVRLDFPLNIYLLGVFASQHWDQEPEDSKVTFVPAGITSSNWKAPVSKEMQQNHKLGICAECVDLTAEWKCRQCEVLYCGQCFTKVHTAARALSRHRKSPLDEICEQHTFEHSVCEDHPLQKLEFFCKDCSKVVCSHCVICCHQGHEVTTKKQRNEEGVVELDDAREKATEVLKRLLHTQKKVGDILMVPAMGSKLMPVEQEVTRHFMYLHGALQLLEQSLMERLKCVKNENLHSLELIMNDLNSNIKHVHQLLQEALAAKDPDNIEKVEISALTDKLLAVQQLPSHLVTSDGSSAETSVRFVVDESFLTQINNHCQLEIHVTSSHSLVRTEDLPPNFVIEPIDEDTENDAVTSVSPRPSSVSAISEAALLLIEQVDPDQTHHVTDNTSNKNGRVLRNVKGSSDIVTVCHLRDPTSFYVHRAADAVTLENLCKQLDRHVHAFNTPPESVLKDGLYVVQYQGDGKWYRARVRGIVPSSSENTKEELADILYIDYGNSEIIPCTKLRCILPKFACMPAMALHCSLFGLAPCNDKWSQEAVKTFAMMVNGYRVKMIIMEHSADTYHVDLCQLPGGAQDNDVPASVRDALVFLEHAYFVAEIKPKVTLAQRTAKYFQEDYLKKGEVVDVVMSHIESPHSFYVQRLGEHAHYLTSLMKDMNVEYTESGNKGFVYTPYIGMPCAAQYTVDKKWYRAKITNLPGNRLVEVFYVDYGNQEVMAWNRIRKLQTRFLRITAQAIHCSLSDIVPNQQQWIPAVREFLIKVTAKKILRLYVDEVQQLQLKVTLYESEADVDLCINGLLVREGYATSVGVSSSLVEYHKLGGLPLHLPPHNTNGRTQVRVFDIEVQRRIFEPETERKEQEDGENYMQIRPKFGNKKTVKNMKAQRAGGAGIMTVSQQSEAEKCEAEKNPFRLEVKVLTCPTPSCIYVTLVSQEEQIKNLMCELQEYYATSSSHTHKWEVNNKCCAFSMLYKQWYRAIIMELLPNQQAKVFLKDFAEVEVVPLLNLQLLDPNFLHTRDGAIKCHLAGIQAAGDKPEWPGLACEYLAEQITKYPNIYITKKGDIENWSLPVELWVKQVKQGGPLEPAVEEWLTLNKKLVEQGLAIPLRRESEVHSSLSLQVLQELNEHSLEENNNYVSDQLKLSVQGDDSLKTEHSEVTADVSCDGSFSDTEDEAGTEEEEQSLSLAHSDWLPPEPVSKMQFIATPTYVDDDCFIYLHDTEKSGDTLTVIGNALHSRFRDSQPKLHDLYWFPGQLCIAQYHADKKWYRGKVVEVNDDRTVKVLFVDYGNIEECKASEMRKNVYMSNIPILCHKCQLDGIKPASEDGKWPTSTLDFIHTTIVEKLCHVTVKQEPEIGQPLVISLVGPGNIDIAELLIRMQFAVYSNISKLDTSSESGTLDEGASVIIEDENETEVIVENEEKTDITTEHEEETVNVVDDKEKIENIVEDGEIDVSDEHPSGKETENSESNVNDMTLPQTDEHLVWNNVIDQEEKSQKVQKEATGNVLHYKQLQLPDSDVFAVEVTAILSSTEMVIHPCKVKGSELLEMKEDFERLTKDLQEEAQYQPLIQNPYVGQPCCACYTVDDQWYRAAVLAVESKEDKQKMLKIHYVDYGNVEYQPIDKVHILKPAWTAVPVQGLRCHMWCIQIPDDWDPQVLFPKLMECLFRPPLLARIKTRQPLLEVELFTSDGSALILQPLVDAGLLMVQKEEKSVL